jgi:hypothetical protein
MCCGNEVVTSDVKIHPEGWVAPDPITEGTKELPAQDMER